MDYQRGDVKFAVMGLPTPGSLQAQLVYIEGYWATSY